MIRVKDIGKVLGPVALCCVLGISSFVTGHRPVAGLTTELAEARGEVEDLRNKRDRLAADLSAVTGAARGDGALAAARISTLEGELEAAKGAQALAERKAEQAAADATIAFEGRLREAEQGRQAAEARARRAESGVDGLNGRNAELVAKLAKVTPGDPEAFKAQAYETLAQVDDGHADTVATEREKARGKFVNSGRLFREYYHESGGGSSREGFFYHHNCGICSRNLQVRQKADELFRKAKNSSSP